MGKRENKILMVTPAKDVKGGMTAVVCTLMDGLTESNYSVDLFYTYKSNYNFIIKVLYSISRLFYFLFIVHKYDLFHIHCAAYGSFYRKMLYACICRLFKKKVIFHIHGSKFEEFQGKNSFNKMVVKKTLDKVDVVLALSRSMKALAERYCSNKKIYILNNPVQMAGLQDIPEKTGVRDGKVHFLFMGEIGKRKGIYDIVDAVQGMAPDMREKVIFNICGNNEIVKLSDLIRKNRVEENFRIRGWVQGDEKKQLLINSDVYILPSYHEGLPVSILEAMSFLLPVISTNAGGIPEIVVDGYNGIVVKPGDPEGIREAVIKLVSDKKMRIRFGQNGRKLAEKYEAKQVINELMDIYKKTLGA